MTSAEIAVVFGFGIVAYVFSEWSFKLSESSDEWQNRLGLFLAFCALLFLNLVVFAVLKITENDLTYLFNSVAMSGLKIIMWVSIVIIVIFGMALFLSVLKLLHKYLNNFRGKRERRTYGEDDRD